MNRLRYLALVAALLVLMLGFPLGYAWSNRNASRNEAIVICEATNRVNNGLIQTWDYLEGRVRATRPNDQASIDLLEHLKSFAPQVKCK